MYMGPNRYGFRGFLSWTEYIFHPILFPSSSLVLTYGLLLLLTSVFIPSLIHVSLRCNKCLRQGIKNRHSVIDSGGELEICVFYRVRVWAARPHPPTRESVKYPSPPPPPPGENLRSFQVSPAYFCPNNASRIPRNRFRRYADYWPLFQSAWVVTRIVFGSMAFLSVLYSRTQFD